MTTKRGWCVDRQTVRDGGKALGDPPAKSMKVLVLEDEMKIVASVRKAVEAQGWMDAVQAVAAGPKS